MTVFDMGKNADLTPKEFVRYLMRPPAILEEKIPGPLGVSVRVFEGLPADCFILGTSPTNYVLVTNVGSAFSVRGMTA